MKDLDDAKKTAADYIARRRRTGKELADRLKKAGYDEEIISQTAEWAEVYGFIDDAQYARIFIEEQLRSHKYGIDRIVRELKHRGIDSFTLEDVFAEFEQPDEVQILVELLKKKIGNERDRKTVDRAVRHFVTRGYRFSDIYEALGRLRLEIEQGEDDAFEQ